MSIDFNWNRLMQYNVERLINFWQNEEVVRVLRNCLISLVQLIYNFEPVKLN